MIQMSHCLLIEDEISAAVEVMRSGEIRQGRVTAAFEQAFADRVGARYAVATSSGTAALHLAYMAVLQPGDEVLVPAFTFVATASMVIAAGGVPVMCDIDPQSWLIDLDDAERSLSSRTRAIAPVHLFGNPCDIETVTKFAECHNLAVIWDAAQACGARFSGCGIGANAPLVCYSLYPTKNLFVGEGGVICTSSAMLAEQLRQLRNHGQIMPFLYVQLGFNYRMTDVAAAIGLHQLNRLDAMLGRRRRNAMRLTEGLSALPGLATQRIMAAAEPAWNQFCVRIIPEIFGLNRDQLARELGVRGIATGLYYPRGLNHQPLIEQRYGNYVLPVTDLLAQQILALPVHHGLSDVDVDRIVDAVIEVHELVRNRPRHYHSDLAPV